MSNSDDLYGRFCACPPEALAWAEVEAQADLKARYESRAALNAQAHTLTALLMAGIGGSLTFAAKVFEPAPGVIAWAAAALCVWFVLVACVTVVRCLQAKAVPALFNRPSNLLHGGHTFAELRASQLVLLDERSQQVAALNAELAQWLNRCRLMTIWSPGVFVFAALIAHGTR